VLHIKFIIELKVIINFSMYMQTLLQNTK